MKKGILALGCLTCGTYFYFKIPLPGFQIKGEPYQLLPKASKSDHPNKHFLTSLPMKTICIIGGGIAGCITAKTLTQQGYQVEVLDKNPSFGGLWYKNYDGSGLQYQREHYNIPDFPFESKEDFPHSPEIVKYIESYAEKFGIKPYFKFNTKVENIKQELDKTWTVITEEGKKNYDFLILCTGSYNKPYIPKIHGSERFKGKILHSSEFINVENEYKGKKIIVIGSGKSAFDVINQARKYGADVSAVMHRIHWLVPLDIDFFGIPLCYLNLSRFGGLFLDPYYSEKSWFDLVTGFFSPLYWHAITWAIKRGLPYPLQSKESYKKEKCFGDGVMDREISDEINQGNIMLYRDKVDEISENGVKIHGKIVPADIVVFATGFKREFFSLPVEKDGLWLYRNILIPGKKNLAVIGIVNTYCNPLYMNIQAVWLAEVLRGSVRLPKKKIMFKDVENRKTYTRDIISGDSTISFSWFPYPPIDQLLTDMEISRIRKPSRFKHWFEPIKPEDYKTVVTHRE
ncbi:hypothetical protein SteCoe_28820 [Stentor coeruleus]|uniref:FAD/NAD(P)-binding domain-containing protein n=1 Tax=Stentor coeruleus TaxID=5963 RepID=A0A1R2B7G2_9CILI|nr:hypothetical protein SteCoe_28820 [Stentor coeruleus]